MFECSILLVHFVQTHVLSKFFFCPDTGGGYYRLVTSIISHYGPPAAFSTQTEQQIVEKNQKTV